VRVNRPDRRSVRLLSSDLDSLLPPDHSARAVWLYVERMDLEPLYAQVRARGSHPGRPATDPALLLSLWLFATLEGVGSARQLDRLCTEHIAYRWLCGGVSVNAHTLADFRVAHTALLERFLVEGVSRLMAGGLVDMARVAQDGVRVRANA
jgi:transposase